MIWIGAQAHALHSQVSARGVASTGEETAGS